MKNQHSKEERIALFSPPDKNTEGLLFTLRNSRLDVEICESLVDLCQKIGEGAGAILLTDDVLASPDFPLLSETLKAEAFWSEIPLILINLTATSRGPTHPPEEREAQLSKVALAHRMIVLEWPQAPLTLLTTMKGALRDRRRQYQMRDLLLQRENVLSSISDAFVTIDRDGRYTYVNKKATELYGHSEKELLGKRIWEVFPDSMGSVFHNRIHKVTTEREVSLFETYVPALGRWFNNRIYPSQDGITVFSTDITDRKNAERELLTLNQTLEHRVREHTAVADERARQLRALATELTQVEQRRRRRLAQALHENIQQILVTAKIQMGMLRRSGLESSIAQGLASTEELLNRSIATSRSIASELSPPVLYDAGLAHALEWFSRQIFQDHEFTLNLRVESGIEERLGDLRVFLFEAIRDLVYNILYHSGVKIGQATLELISVDVLRVIVQDEGDGFEHSWSRRKGENREKFGLFGIHERIAHLGGTLDIKSAPQAGTRITLLLPLDQPNKNERVNFCENDSRAEDLLTPLSEIPQSLASLFKKGGPRPIRVLLADDHKILREGLARLIREEPGIELVSEASDGQMAVDMARATHPDVIVMDISMPKLNGIEATRIIRAEFPLVKVIGLSMHAAEDMAEAMRKAGATDFVSKEEAAENLIKAIRSSLSRIPGSAPHVNNRTNLSPISPACAAPANDLPFSSAPTE